VDDEVQLLRRAGHDVVLWAPTISGNDRPLRAAANAIWSRQEAANVRELVASYQPDVIHVHSLYPRLSPSVIRVAARSATPIVLTLHNFRLMCLPATFLRNGKICEACAGHVPWRGVVHGCYRGSRQASAAMASSLVIHRLGRTFDGVKLFLAVSDFIRRMHVRYGLEERRVRVKQNFSWPLPRREGAGSTFLALGRLSPEKGIDTAINAIPDGAALTVVGDGPDGQRLRGMAAANVSFVGEVGAEAVPSCLATARAVLVPSRCYEGAPRSIIEAFAAGVPVIASDIGGIAELVEDGVNGVLVDREDSRGWRDAVERLLDDGESSRLGRGAYDTWRARFSPARATTDLEGAYALAQQ
jgi:glycosyltransferase involved in cell wall biosynthesis